MGSFQLPNLTFSSVSSRGLDAERLMLLPSFTAPSSSLASCNTPKLLVLRRLCLQTAGAGDSCGSMVRLDPPENCRKGPREREEEESRERRKGSQDGRRETVTWNIVELGWPRGTVVQGYKGELGPSTATDDSIASKQELPERAGLRCSSQLSRPPGSVVGRRCPIGWPGDRLHASHEKGNVLVQQNIVG